MSEGHETRRLSEYRWSYRFKVTPVHLLEMAEKYVLNSLISVLQSPYKQIKKRTQSKSVPITFY